MIDQAAALDRVRGRAATLVADAGFALVYRVWLQGPAGELVPTVMGDEGAAIAEHFRPGSVELVPTKLAAAIRFQRYPRGDRRAVTPQRLAAAERKLARDREEAGLFAAHVAAEQPTAEERISAHDDGSVAWWKEQRDHRARQWRELRGWIATSFTPEQRAALLTRWRDFECPGEPTLCRSFLSNWSK